MIFETIMDNGRFSKIHKLLNKLLEPNFEISEVQLDILSNHLPDLYYGQPVDEDFFISWFDRFIETWKTPPQNISTKNFPIIADITGIFCRKEHSFLNLITTGIIDGFFQILQSLPNYQTTPYKQHFYIRLLTNFLKHKSGLLWIIQRNYWQDIIVMTVQKTDDLIFKEGCVFIIELLEKTKNDNEVIHNNVIKILIAPLIYLNTFTTINTNETLSEITKRLITVEHVFKELLARNCIERDFKFISILQDNFNIESILEELSSKELLKDYKLQISKMLSLIIYFSLAKYMKEHSPSNSVVDGEGVSDKQINYFLEKIHSVIKKISATTDGYSIVLELLDEDHIYFSLVVNSLIGEHIITQFQYQMLPFLLIPITQSYFTIRGDQKSIAFQDERLKVRLIQRLQSNVQPLSFKNADNIKRSFSVEDVSAAFSHIQSCSRFYNHEVVITITQLFMHMFGSITDFFLTTTDHPTELAHEFLTGLLETLIYLFTEFQLAWKDVIEIIYVKHTISILLTLKNVTEKLVTRSLQLLNVAFRKNLSPKLNLLIDFPKEKELPEELRKSWVLSHLQHTNWDIRNASVQVVHAIAQTKKDYEITKATLTQLNIPEVILNMAISDPEHAVKVSAIRCLGNILSIDELWEILSKIPNFYDKIMQMFYLESNGVLRNEAIVLITTIYEKHKLTNTILEKFYDVMSYSVLEDEFCPVKTNALGFWQKVIDKHLTDEGLIDGEFPDVTFSKKRKKIITFNERVIKECLEGILHNLDKIGCLTAFLFAINSPEKLLEQTSLNLIKPFIHLLKKHYVVTATSENCRRNSDGVISDSPLSSVDSAYSTPSSNIFSLSPFPEHLYDNLIDMDKPEKDQFSEFVKFVENFDFEIYNRINRNDIKILLDSLLG